MRPLGVLVIIAVLTGCSLTETPSETPGLHVYSVSELQAARAAGKVSGGPIALAGFWSYHPLVSSCVSDGEPGELQLCGQGAFGITERDEPILAVIGPKNTFVFAKGPTIVPYVPDGALGRVLFDPPGAHDSPPVPIEVVGHMDDPRAAQCRPTARKSCQDRFVIDQIVAFAPRPGG